MSKVLGIDLGTTNSCMAILEGDTPTIIPNAEGDRTTPSVVAFSDGERLVGKVALNQHVMNAGNTIYSVKRFIGRTCDELDSCDTADLTYRIETSEKDRPIIVTESREEYLPEAISAMVLAKLKCDAEAFTGEILTKAVITVPAYFNDTQRQATRDAGSIAGLDVLRIINEPTAAALAFGYNGGDAEDTTILVYDFGGGTLDVSILEISNGLVQVVSTAGNNYLGGDDIDALLTQHLCNRFFADTGIDLAADDLSYARVRSAARSAKEDLSSTQKVIVNLPFVAASAQGPVHMNYEVTRHEFEEVIADIIEDCKTPIIEALEGPQDNPACLSTDDIDHVLLVGGSTRIPAIQQMIETLFGKEPERTLNPDEVVAMGAAVQGGVLEGDLEDIVLSDVCSMTLSIKAYPNICAVMIPKNSPIPTSSQQIFTTRDDNQDNVEIVIIQGEDPEANSPRNKVIGTAVLEGIPAMPGGVPRIQVTMTYDADGIIQVSAQETASGSSIQVRIEGTSRLDTNEVQALAAQEQQHEADRQRGC